MEETIVTGGFPNIIIAIALFMWFWGIIIIRTNNAKENIESAFKVMWGYRQAAFGCLVILIDDINHVYLNNKWMQWEAIYCAVIGAIFIALAVNEYYADNKFRRLYHKKYGDN